MGCQSQSLRQLLWLRTVAFQSCQRLRMSFVDPQSCQSLRPLRTEVLQRERGKGFHHQKGSKS